MASFGVGPAGYRAPRAEELLRIQREALDNALGSTLDYAPDTFEGVATAVWAAQLGDLCEGSVQALADALDPNNASGALLDNLLALFGIAREQASPSSALLTPTLSGAAFVPQGTRFGQTPSDPDNFDVWVAAEDTALTGAPGETILVQCERLGPVAAAPGSIVQLLDTVPGLTAVTNAQAATLGRARQTDREARQARLRLLSAAGSGTLGAIFAAVTRAVPSGVYVGVLENTSSGPAVIGGLPMLAHSHAAIIYPVQPSDVEDAIRAAIYLTRPAGGATSGDQLGTVFDEVTGNTVSVPFFYATALPVAVRLTSTRAPGVTLGEVQAAAEAVLAAWFDRLRVGDPVRRLALCAELAAIDGLLGVDVELDEGAGFAAADVLPGPARVATLSAVVVV